jgi:hypothetical protein
LGGLDFAAAVSREGPGYGDKGYGITFKQIYERTPWIP